MIHKFCSKLSEAMTSYIDCPEKKEWLTYGLELIFGEFLKFGLILGIAYFMNILPITVLILALALPYRVITGGGHSSTFFRCTIITILVYLLLSLFAWWFILTFNTGIVLRLFPVVALIAFLVVEVWVPGVELNTNLQRKIANKKYKRLAKIYLLIWIVSSILIINFSDSYKVYFVCSMVGILWQTFFVTPAGYSILRYSEKVFDILEKKEVQTKYE